VKHWRESNKGSWPNRVGQALALMICSFSGMAMALAGAREGSRLPAVAFDVTIEAPAEHSGPKQLHGTMRVRDWNPRHGACIYLPYADPDYGDRRSGNRRFDLLSSPAPRPVFLGGQQSIQAALPAQVEATSLGQLVRINPGSQLITDELAFTFDAVVPRLPMSRDGDWFYDGFLPQLLAECPEAGQDPEYYRTAISTHQTGQLHIPTGWNYAGPGDTRTPGAVTIDLTARGLAFALEKSEQGFLRKDFQAAGVPVTLFYHSESFRELEATVSETLPVLVEILGPYPYPTLTIVETSELQRHGLPALIAMNRPAQALFNKVQRSLLNWQHWIFAIQLTHQWYGSAIAAATPDDDWLVSGIAEFATLEALSRHPARFNLFNASAGFRLLSFDYLQISEVTAALLRRNAPLAILTDSKLKSKSIHTAQSPLLFIKQTSAMRQLKSAAGDQVFFRFTRNLTQHFLHSFISPAEFYDYFSHRPSPFSPSMRQTLTTSLKNWWTSSGWPDFALERVDKTELPDGRWISEISASQKGGVDFAPLLGVKDLSGHYYLARSAKNNKAPDAPWVASVVTPSKPGDGEVDPTHETFDENRFNNHLGLPDLTFFPGQADTLRDDAYTILWVPYAFKRPGEPFSLGLQAALFKYINSGLLLRFEAAPGTTLAAISLSDSFRLPDYALNGSVDFSQNYDRDGLAQVALSRSPVGGSNPELSLGLSLRRRARAAEPESAHGTFAISATLRPAGSPRVCSYSLNGQQEKAPGAFAKGFQYDRSQAAASSQCNITNRIALSARAFRGLVTGDGQLPQVALFKPTDLKEAHLRLDQRGLNWSRSIASGSLDLLLPFHLPIPSDSLLLTRQMRWRLFYDIGRSIDLGQTYRDGGFGFLLPFGGDLSGAGSLALTRLSCLVIAYSDVAGSTSRKPSLLLDLSGEL